MPRTPQASRATASAKTAQPKPDDPLGKTLKLVKQLTSELHTHRVLLDALIASQPSIDLEKLFASIGSSPEKSDQLKGRARTLAQTAFNRRPRA